MTRAGRPEEELESDLLKRPASKRILRWASAAATMLFIGCGLSDSTSRWRVVAREDPKNSSGFEVYEVKVVLEHGGHRYHALCNNLKGGSIKDQVYRCELYVGNTVRCQWYKQREMGYDLICGDKRNEKGELDTFGESELLQIEREEK